MDHPTPARTTAAAFPRYLHGRIVADSTALRWPGLYARRVLFPRVVDRFLVPATAEPLISCSLAGTAEFREREDDGRWVTRHLRRGDLFVTRSKTPYEISIRSPAGEELETISIHLAVEPYREALATAYPDQADRRDLREFFGRDEALAYLCYACAEMLATHTPGDARCLADFTRLLASFLVARYAGPATAPLDFHGGLPIRQLRRVEDYLGEHLAEGISVAALAALVDLSPFHFCRVFKQTTGTSPLQYLTRERITRSQQLIRETSRSLIDIALEVGYTSPSHFAQVFRRVVGVTPSAFRAGL